MPFQALITKILGYNFIHIVLVLVIIVSSILSKKERLSKRHNYAFIIFIILSLLFTQFNPDLLIYGFIPSTIFVFLFLNYEVTEEVFHKSIELLTYISIIISLIAIYQFFVDPTFLGLEKTIYTKVGGVDKPRVNSVLPSYQSLSTFLACIIVLNIKNINKLKIALICLLNFLALITTFTRNGWMILFIVLLMTAFQFKLLRLRYVIIVLLFIFATSMLFTLDFVLERFISTFDTEEGGNMGRMLIYKWYLGQMDAVDYFFGKGIGISSQRYALRLNGQYWFSIESNYFKLFFEGGIFYLALFSYIQISTIFKAYKANYTVEKNALYLLIAFVPLLIFVHILEIWTINFIFWFLIFYIAQSHARVYNNINENIIYRSD